LEEEVGYKSNFRQKEQQVQRPCGEKKFSHWKNSNKMGLRVSEKVSGRR
jgi:hypothetical protein